MLTATDVLLRDAQMGGYAVGAFNVYNLEGALAVCQAAAACHSPAILQVHPAAFAYGGASLLALCLQEADACNAPISVHFDHSSDVTAIEQALALGVRSIMADGSDSALADNIAFTKAVTEKVHAVGGVVEGELGRLAGNEDGLDMTVKAAKMTDPEQAADFVAQTGIDALAVCIGNVHGKYAQPPALDFMRLEQLQQRVSVPLVLHGASGLPKNQLKQAIALGVCKFNVNTDLRQAFTTSLANTTQTSAELITHLTAAVAAMSVVVVSKIQTFGSNNRTL